MQITKRRRSLTSEIIHDQAVRNEELENENAALKEKIELLKAIIKSNIILN
jgi:hypothetical protein